VDVHNCHTQHSTEQFLILQRIVMIQMMSTRGDTDCELLCYCLPQIYQNKETSYVNIKYVYVHPQVCLCRCTTYPLLIKLMQVNAGNKVHLLCPLVGEISGKKYSVSVSLCCHLGFWVSRKNSFECCSRPFCRPDALTGAHGTPDALTQGRTDHFSNI